MIVPSIDIQDGGTVQLVGGKDKALDAGDPRVVAEGFGIAGEIAVIDLDAAMGVGSNAAVIRELCRTHRCRVGGGIRSVDAALDWLDAGAEAVILGTAARPEILSQLPRDRVIAAVDAVDGEVVVEGWVTRTGRQMLDVIRELAPHVGGFLVTFVEREGRLGGTALDQVAAIVEAAGDARVTIAGGVSTAEEVAALDRLGADAQVGMALYTGRMSLADATWATLRSDRADELVPTVITDERGTALGLAYSSRASLDEALQQRRGVYWSRSRDALWVKGATSGATQTLLRVDADCDRDTLRFTVRQAKPGFCHLDTRTCWGVDRGLGRLDRTLAARVGDAPAGSYTRRLLDDPDLLAAKLREEVEELIAAEGVPDVGHEAADVLYFALVAAARAGVRLEDIERELDRRRMRVRRRRGDAKPPVAPPSSLPEPGERLLRTLGPDEVPALRHDPVDAETLAGAGRIVDAVRVGGEAAVRRFGERFGDVEPGGRLVFDRNALEAVLAQLGADQPGTVGVLERVAGRIRGFAEARRRDCADTEIAVPAGRAGVRLQPVERAGCYAPGGRYPLPSSVLMTALTAKAAGVREVWVASPRPTPVTLAAAAIAGADGLLAVGGAQAIAALAYGAGPVPPCDAIVGPGNRWVTAAKQRVAGHVAIDMLAGPSELVVLADASADPQLVAADLLAQAEHDVDALPVLVALDRELVDAVEAALRDQLETLRTAEVARAALTNGFAVAVDGLAVACAVVNRLAPEHLAVHVADVDAATRRLEHYGALFIGGGSAEVFGDYGAGPNHVLPTGGTARAVGALDVLTFLRPQGWLRLDTEDADYDALVTDTAALGRLEGLEAHARAADVRRRSR